MCFHCCATTSVLARRGISHVTLAIADVSSHYCKADVQRWCDVKVTYFCFKSFAEGGMDIKVICRWDNLLTTQMKNVKKLLHFD
jgi:hypothetical protein